MKVYLVRHIATKEFQGIFWGSVDAIWDIFDEMGDPYGFEYAPVSAGALFSEAAVGKGQRWGADIDWGQFHPSESLSLTFAEDCLRWKPFDCSTEGHGLVARVARANAEDKL